MAQDPEDAERRSRGIKGCHLLSYFQVIDHSHEYGDHKECYCDAQPDGEVKRPQEVQVRRHWLRLRSDQVELQGVRRVGEFNGLTAISVRG